jgi:hypothetical protein
MACGCHRGHDRYGCFREQRPPKTLGRLMISVRPVDVLLLRSRAPQPYADHESTSHMRE